MGSGSPPPPSKPELVVAALLGAEAMSADCRSARCWSKGRQRPAIGHPGGHGGAQVAVRPGASGDRLRRAERGPLLEDLGVELSAAGNVRAGPDWQTAAPGIFVGG